MKYAKWFSQDFEDYQLIDAGGGMKYEHFGKLKIIRPELQAYFSSSKPHNEWKKEAQLLFNETTKSSGAWKGQPTEWTISYKELQLHLACTKFKHIGIFPEQEINWRYIEEHIYEGQRFLNLFAYTGVASLVARAQGAEVVHVDAVKQLLTWAKQNMESSGLSDIKWVLEDALKFAQREVKRGNKYHGICMDPPAWGIGANGEKWKLSELLPELIDAASKLLYPNGFLILNTYSPSVTLEEVEAHISKYFSLKNSEIGELWSKTNSNKELFRGFLARATK